uniref:Uncharacterized protein n=1 Tax=Castor canadensis TaxID=51338 RepID=A0A8C0XTM2_CASCN
MALRRVFSVRTATLRLALLSTAPAAREQPTLGPRAVPACGTADAARPRVPVVDFGNAQEAYRSRQSWELARNLLVLRLCSSRALLAYHEQVRMWAGGWMGGWGGGQVDKGGVGHLPGPGTTMEFGSVKKAGYSSIACS